MQPISAAVGGVIASLVLVFAVLGCTPGPSPASPDYPCGTRGRSCGGGLCCGQSEECGTGAGGVSLRVNGVEVISGALTAPSAANATTGLMFGGDAVGAASNVTGYIGKGLLVPRALTVAECAQFEAYCVGATL